MLATYFKILKYDLKKRFPPTMVFIPVVPSPQTVGASPIQTDSDQSAHLLGIPHKYREHGILGPEMSSDAEQIDGDAVDGEALTPSKRLLQDDQAPITNTIFKPFQQPSFQNVFKSF